MLPINNGNIQIPGSKGLLIAGNLVLSDNIIINAGNIPKIIVYKTTARVGKNIIQESRRFFLLLTFCSDNIKLDDKLGS